MKDVLIAILFTILFFGILVGAMLLMMVSNKGVYVIESQDKVKYCVSNYGIELDLVYITAGNLLSPDICNIIPNKLNTPNTTDMVSLSVDPKAITKLKENK